MRGGPWGLLFRLGGSLGGPRCGGPSGWLMDHCAMQTNSAEELGTAPLEDEVRALLAERQRPAPGAQARATTAALPPGQSALLLGGTETGTTSGGERAFRAGAACHCQAALHRPLCIRRSGVPPWG